MWKDVERIHLPSFAQVGMQIIDCAFLNPQSKRFNASGASCVLLLLRLRSQIFAAKLGEAVAPAFMVIVASCGGRQHETCEG